MPDYSALLKALSPMRPELIKARSALADIAEQTLKGTKATAEQWYNQLAGKPGVKQMILEQQFGHHKGSPLLLMKKDFVQSSKQPKLYVQKGVGRKVEAENYRQPTAYDAAVEQVYDMYDDTAGSALQFNIMRDLAGRYAVEDDLLAAHPRREQLVERFLNYHYPNQMGLNADDYDEMLGGLTGDDYAIFDRIDNGVKSTYSMFDHPEFQQVLDEVLTTFDPNRLKPTAREINIFPGYQRISPTAMAKDKHGRWTGDQEQGYFESVLRGPAGRDAYSQGILNEVQEPNYDLHFGNNRQLAHARGTVDKLGEVWLEELQSDPRELAEAMGYKIPQLQTPEADMAKAMILQAARGGANAVHLPTPEGIAAARNASMMPFIKSIYGDSGQLGQKVLGPLEKLGAPMYETKTAVPPSRDISWRTLDLSDPDFRQALIKDGLPFKNGGLVPSKNGFLTGGLNLVNPKNNANGPLDIQWNANNMIQSGRARPQGLM